MKPIIGITASAQTDTLVHGTFRRYVVSRPYVRAVEAAGGIAIALPPQDDSEALAEMIDGLLLSGGADMEPSRYGDRTIHPETYGIDPERDQFEIELFDAMVAQEKPVFGICRGIQVVNVALGGTLIQDVATEHPGATEVGHRQHERDLPDCEVGHAVTAVHPDLLPIFADGQLGVNSFHHQAIRELGSKLTAVAHAPDGLVEAVAMTDRPSVFAVQWHPELMFKRHPEHLRPFAHFITAARSRKLIAAVA